MPSAEVYRNLLSTGLRVDLCPYNRFDSLESEEDLQELKKVLLRFTDKAGKHPVFTMNTLVANPDFGRIEAANFNEYYFEPFPETFKKYPFHKNSKDILKQGLGEGVFFPQFHGREHLNVNRWMKMLREGSEETLLTFRNNLFGISTNITREKRKSYMAALDLQSIEELDYHRKLLKEGLDLFEEIFGFRSASFVAPNYTWHSSLENLLFSEGIRYLQGSGYQIQPEGGKSRNLRHKLGETNESGQIYLTRNCSFEPSLNSKKDCIGSALSEISAAFFWNKPAVISTHRLNFIGSVDQSNRERNLTALGSLLQSILTKWPSVEFMTTTQIGSLIEKELI